MARVSRKRKQEQAVEKLAVSRDEVYQCAVYIRLSKEENEKSGFECSGSLHDVFLFCRLQ